MIRLVRSARPRCSVANRGFPPSSWNSSQGETLAPVGTKTPGTPRRNPTKGALMDAFAQGGAAAPANSGSPVVQFLPIIAIMVIMYFLIIRPQQRKQKQADDAQGPEGDRVLTNGGILATVSASTTRGAQVADDTKVEFAKSAIVRCCRSRVMSVDVRPAACRGQSVR
jgi:preprotein translocase subunit YajC